MDFIRSTSEKVKLWRVEHFFPPFFSRSMLIGGKFIFYKKIHYKICKCCNFNQSALIWKKTGEKSVQLVRVSLFWKYFLWNPYFSRIDWCEGHWLSSTYMAVRLSDIRAKAGKKCIFCVFRLFLPLCRTASRPYRLSYINALPDVGSSHVFRVIEQCCFNSVSDWLF